MPTPIEIAVQSMPNRRRRRVRPARFPRGSERQYVAQARDIERAKQNLVHQLLIERLPELARLAGVRADSLAEWRNAEPIPEAKAAWAEIPPGEILRDIERAREAFLRNDAARFDQSPWRSLLRTIMRDITNRFQRAESFAREAAEGTGAQVSAFGRRELSRQLRSAIGIDIFAEAPDLLDALEEFTEANVSHIVTTSPANFATIERVVSQGFQSGQRASTIADSLVKALGVQESRALFWARDQIGSLTSQLAQKRQTALGVESYVWSTSKDERVRESHRQLEGTVHRWDNPPTVNGRQVHPGEDYQCRCDPIPIIPGVSIEKTGPEDVPRNPELVKRKRARDRRQRENARRRAAGLPPIQRRPRGRAMGRPIARREIPAQAEARTVRLPRTGRNVNLTPAQALRQDVAKALTDRQTRSAATTGQRLDRLLWQWVHGSKRKPSIELKQAAIQEFRLRGIAYNPRRLRVDPADVRQSASDLRALFRRTQKHLAEQGRQRLKVYRGIRGEVGQRGAVESWTTSRRQAEQFAGTGGRVLEETVPAERVLAIQGGPHWQDGVWGNQGEVMVMF